MNELVRNIGGMMLGEENRITQKKKYLSQYHSFIHKTLK